MWPHLQLFRLLPRRPICPQRHSFDHSFDSARHQLSDNVSPFPRARRRLCSDFSRNSATPKKQARPSRHLFVFEFPRSCVQVASFLLCAASPLLLKFAVSGCLADDFAVPFLLDFWSKSLGRVHLSRPFRNSRRPRLFIFSNGPRAHLLLLPLLLSLNPGNLFKSRAVKV